MDFGKIFRPEKFSDFVGQAEAVAYLQGQVQSRSDRSVLIAGGTGTGVNSSAEVYAAALVCEGGGGPCGTCESCDHLKQNDPHPTLLFIDAADKTLNFVESILVRLQRIPRGARRVVVVVRNADRADHRDWQTLQGPIARMRRATIILATHRPEDVPAQTKSLLQIVSLKDADYDSRLELLQRVCQDAKVEISLDALRSIAIHAEPGFRAPLRDLERLLLNPVTQTSVDNFYGGAATDHAAAYLKSVFSKTQLADQTQILTDRGVVPEDVTKVIEALLRFYLHGVSPKNRAFYSIQIEIRNELVLLAADCALRLKIRVDQLYGRILEIWVTDSRDVASVYLKAVQFHEFIDGKEPTKVHRPPRRRLVSSEQGIEEGVGYLTRRQLVEILDCAAVMVQGFGQMFNARMIVRYRREHVAEAVTRIAQEFRQRVVRKRFPGAFHHIHVHERDDRGSSTRVVMYLPDLKWDVPGWLAEFKREYPGIESIDFERFPHNDWRAHAKLLRELCRGVDPGDTIIVRRPGGLRETRSLLDLLGVPSALRASIGAFPLGGHRCDGSRHLKKRARESTELPYRGIGTNRDWTRVFDPAQLDEYERRQRNLKAFDAEKAKLEKSGLGAAALTDAIAGLRRRFL